MKAAPSWENGAAELQRQGVDSQSELEFHTPDASSASSAAPSSSRRLRESDDAYPRVIVYLSPKHRVINCLGDIQWIEQIRKGDVWRNRSFFRNRDVMIERSGASGAALVTLRMLPRTHP
jgi:hypothetical protein